MVIMVEDHWLQCQPLSKVVIIVVVDDDVVVG
jgi:hypothetical protein